jgi:hypothetical protein
VNSDRHFAGYGIVICCCSMVFFGLRSRSEGTDVDALYPSDWSGLSECPEDRSSEADIVMISYVQVVAVIDRSRAAKSSRLSGNSPSPYPPPRISTAPKSGRRGGFDAKAK